MPTPISGECTDLPGDLIYHGASDYTATEGNGDYIEHGIFAMDAWSNVYLVDWWRDQRSTDVWIEREHDLIIGDAPLIWFG